MLTILAQFSIEPSWLGWMVFLSAPLGWVLLVAAYFTLDKRYELKSEAAKKADALAKAVETLQKLQTDIDGKLEREVREILSTVKAQETGLRSAIAKLSDGMTTGFLGFATSIGMIQGQLGVIIAERQAANKNS